MSDYSFSLVIPIHKMTERFRYGFKSLISLIIRLSKLPENFEFRFEKEHVIKSPCPS